jgi:hypothetical protein
VFTNPLASEPVPHTDPAVDPSLFTPGMPTLPV